MISTLLKNALVQQMERLSGLPFQEFIEELFILKYGNNFVPVKQKRDKGCDGILNGDTILAVYAPEKPDIQLFRKKIKEDHQKYLENFSSQYPQWQVIYNGNFTRERVDYILSLEKNAVLTGIKHLLEIITTSPWHHIRRVAEYLQINPDFLENDVLKQVIDDLMHISGAVPEDENPGFTKTTYIEDKVRLNFKEEDIEAALDEYEENLCILNRVRDIVQPYENLGVLKTKIRLDYEIHNNRCRDFKRTLDSLTDSYAAKYPRDDVYRYYVRSVLIYFFEQCLIGRKSTGEKHAATTS